MVGKLYFIWISQFTVFIYLYVDLIYQYGTSYQPIFISFSPLFSTLPIHLYLYPLPFICHSYWKSPIILSSIISQCTPKNSTPPSFKYMLKALLYFKKTASARCPFSGELQMRNFGSQQYQIEQDQNMKNEWVKIWVLFFLLNFMLVVKLSAFRIFEEIPGLGNRFQKQKEAKIAYQSSEQNLVDADGPSKGGKTKAEGGFDLGQRISDALTSKQILDSNIYTNIFQKSDQTQQQNSMSKLGSSRHLQVLPTTSSSQNSAFSLENLTTLPGSSLIPTNTQPITSREFAGVGLYDEVPDVFILNEIYRFHGVISNPTTFSLGRKQYVNVVFIEASSRKEFRCQGLLQGYQTQFDISCKIINKGRYYLTIFSGQNGKTSSKQRYIASEQEVKIILGADQIKKDQVAPVPEGLRLDVLNNEMTIIWQSVAPISKLVITQTHQNQQKQMVYILSNFHKQFILQYGDYFSFKQGQTIISLSHASSKDNSYFGRNSPFSTSLTQNFQASYHLFSAYMHELISQVTDVPYKMENNQTVSIVGRFNEDIRKQIYLVTPTRKIMKFNVGDANPYNLTVPRGQLIQFDIELDQEGTYILEVNTHYGEAIINRPIYVGNNFPLLPDYQDLKKYARNNNMEYKPLLQQYILNDFKPLQQKMSINISELIEPAVNSTLKAKRQFLLELNNYLRMKYDVGNLYLDDHLNQISQNHADDMVNRNFFAHNNLEGEGPGTRAKKYGFEQQVGENLALSSTLIETHLSLERSAVHLDNSIKPVWTRVGIGIARNNSQYIVVYTYSIRDLNLFPLTSSELSSFQKLVSDYTRVVNPTLKPEDTKFSGLIEKWMKTDRSVGLFDFLVKNGYRYSMQWNIINVDFTTDILQPLKRNTQLLVNQSPYTRFGLGLILTQQTQFQIYTVFY